VAGADLTGTAAMVAIMADAAGGAPTAQCTARIDDCRVGASTCAHVLSGHHWLYALAIPQTLMVSADVVMHSTSLPTVEEQEARFVVREHNGQH
jgi:hypothetical protein